MPPSEPAIFDPPAGSVRRAAGRGALATGIAQLIRFGTQLLSLVILSRLLTPQDFGVIAMAAPVFGFLLVLQDLGLTQATVQTPAIQHGQLSYLFWINALFSVALAAVLVAVSPLVARFYGDARLGPLVAATALQVIVVGFGAQHMALASRRMAFRALAIIDVLSALANLVVSSVIAAITHSYWALLAGTLAGSVVSTVCYWIVSSWLPGRPTLAQSGRLLSFGAGVSGYNLLNFLARNLDNVLIGKVWGEVAIGYYDRAYKLLLFPLNQITNPLAKVMIPALSRLNDEPDAYYRLFERAITLVMLAILPGVAFGIATAQELIPLALGGQWAGSATIFQALGLAGLLQTINNPAGWLFISQGRALDYFRWGLVNSGTSVAAFCIGLPFGALGVAIAYAATEYVRTPILWNYLGRKGPVTTARMARLTAPFMLGAYGALGVLWLAQPALQPLGPFALPAEAAFSYAFMIGALALFPIGRASLRQAIATAHYRNLV